ncbi:MAG TPA: hypothetical protein PKX15_00335 [Bacteroidales bacterium]|nr:hypothetical protein [Bacteroidales bacterium]
MEIGVIEKMNENLILNLIKTTVNHFENEFMNGDCGSFTIALATVLHKRGIPVKFTLFQQNK